MMDLTGHWVGTYAYRRGHSVPFTARLDEVAGLLSGETEEPNSFAPVPFTILLAEIAGWREGRDVVFTKVYAPIFEAHPIHYDGTLNAEGTVLRGQWTIAAGLGGSGRFEMTRPAGGAAETERMAAADL